MASASVDNIYFHSRGPDRLNHLPQYSDQLMGKLLLMSSFPKPHPRARSAPFHPCLWPHRRRVTTNGSPEGRWEPPPPVQPLAAALGGGTLVGEFVGLCAHKFCRRGGSRVPTAAPFAFVFR